MGEADHVPAEASSILTLFDVVVGILGGGSTPSSAPLAPEF